MSLSKKKLDRKNLFKAIGQAISKMGDPNTPDYHTGKQSSFHLNRGDSDVRPGDIPFGPEFKTPQWIRTVR